IEKLIRYHLNRLIALKLVEKSKNKFKFTNSPYHDRQDLQQAFNYHLAQKINSKLKDISEVYQKLADSYKK
ncbi:hypothetical protein HZB89_01595, partial [archaeon]|nr:hypothetical protein [archaeon]